MKGSRSSEVAIQSSAALRNHYQQLEERRRRRRRREAQESVKTPKTPAASFVSRIPTSSSRRRPRPATSGDHLIRSSGDSVENNNNVMIPQQQQQLVDDDLSEDSSISAIWRSTTPFIAQSEKEQRSLTPTGPLLEKLEQLTQTWSATRGRGDDTPSATSVTMSISKSTRKSVHSSDQQPPSQVATTTPRGVAVSTSTTASGKILTKPAAARFTSSIPTTTRRRRVPLQTLEDDADDSLDGTSTISTISSTESVFDRLYRMGIESAEMKRRLEERQRQREEWTSPETPASAAPRRLSYTPKLVLTSPPARHHRPHPKKNPTVKDDGVGGSSSVTRNKNRLPVYSDATTGSKIPRRLSAPEQVDVDDLSFASSTTPSHQEQEIPYQKDSVYYRLYRNVKRPEPLWKAPAAFTPAPKPSSTSKPTGIPSATKPTSSRSKGGLPSMAATSAWPLSTLPNQGSMEDALELLDDLLADSPRTSTTAAATTTDEDTTRWHRTDGESLLAATTSSMTQQDEATGSEEQQDDSSGAILEEKVAELGGSSALPDTVSNHVLEKATTTTLEEDLAEIQELGRELNMQSEESPSRPQTTLVQDNELQSHDTLDDLPYESLHSQEANDTTTIEEDLAEIEEIGQELYSRHSRSRDSGESLRSQEEEAVLDTTIDEDLAEIEDIGKDLYPSHNSGALKPLIVDEEPTEADTTLDEDLQEINNISKEIRLIDGSLPRRGDSLRVEGGRKQHTGLSKLLTSQARPKDSTPAVIYLHDGGDNQEEEVDLLEGIDDVLVEAPKTTSTPSKHSVYGPGFSSAPTPRRRTTKAFTSPEEEDDQKSPASFGLSPSRGPKSRLFVETSEIAATIPSAPTSSSRGSSGFFSLDEPSGGLVLEDPYSAQISRRSPASKTKSVNDSQKVAAVSIQSAWRRYQAEHELTMLLMESCQVELTPQTEIGQSEKSQLLQLALRKSNDPCIGQSLKMDEFDVIVSWETGFPTTISVLVEASTKECRRIVRSWSMQKIARRFVRAALVWKLLEVEVATNSIRDAIQGRDRQPDSESLEVIRSDDTAVLLSLLDDSGNEEELSLLGNGDSLASSSTQGNPTWMDLTLVKQHCAAVTIQNWFRLRMLDAALQESTDSQEQLRKALESMSHSKSHSSSKELSSHKSNMVNARRVLRETYSLENWLDPYDANGSLSTPWSATDGSLSQEWIERRAAALAIHNIVQAYLRGLQRYRRHRKVFVIQAAWHRFVYRRLYLRMRMAACTIQQHWRAHKVLQHAIVAAIQIQSLRRGKLERRRWELVRFSVISIQAAARQAAARRHLRAAHSISRFLQTSWRSLPHRNRYLQFRSAISSLQHLHRQHAQKKIFLQQWSCAIKIQTTWRGYRASQKFKKAWKSTMVIQRNWRRRSCEIHFHRHRQVVTFIQSVWRRRATQKYFSLMRSASTRIQANWRGFQSATLYRKVARNVVAIQSLARRIHARRRYLHSLSRLLLIQAFSRGFLARSFFLHARVSASMIQANWRGTHQRTLVTRQAAAALLIESRIRAHFCRKKVLNMNAAAKQMQRVARALQAQRLLYHWNFSATRIQAAWRASEDRSAFLDLRSTAIMIQAAYRGHRQRVRIQEQLDAVRFLQAILRAALAKQCVRKIRLAQERDRQWQASVRIQARWRTSSVLTRYETTRVASILIQSAVRMWLASRTLQNEKHVSTEVQTAKNVQRYCRGFLVRKRSHQQRSAATAIQSIWRVHRNLQLQRDAVLLLQRAFRGCLVRGRVLLILEATRVIQASLRGTIVRQRYNKERLAAVRLQSTWRSATVRASYQESRSSASMIQACYRGHRERKFHSKKLEGVIEFQRLVRSILARKLLQRLISQDKDNFASAMRIQAWWKGALLSTRYHRQRQACVQLQAAIRGHAALMRYQSKRRAAILIQSHVRAARVREVCAYVVVSVLMIQAACRGCLVRKRNHHRVVACIALQRLWRGYACYRKYQQRRGMRLLYQEARRTKAARRIQRAYRNKYSASRFSAAWNIQRYLRGMVARQVQSRTVASVIKLQAVLRGQKARRVYHRKVCTIIAIQTAWRASLGRDHLIQARAAAIMIQALVRGKIARHQRFIFHAAASAVQKTWRGHHERTRFECQRERKNLYQMARQVKHARKIQRLVRAWLVQRRVNAVLLQSQWRGALQRGRYNKLQRATILLQSLQRCCLAKKKLVQLNQRRNCLVRIQSQWRGSLQRKRHAKARRSVVQLQSLMRRSIARNQYKQLLRNCEDQKRYIRFLHSAIAIQSIVRMWAQRCVFKRTFKCILLIQAEWRRAIAAGDFARARISSVMIQAAMRGYLARVRLRSSQLEKEAARRASVKIQATWRGFFYRMGYLQFRAAVVFLQCWTRMVLVKKNYWFLREPKEVRFALEVAARKIQWAFLLWKMRLAVLEMQSSAVILQRCMRGQLVRSAARFALTHMNSSMRSAPVSPVARVSSPTNEHTLSTMTAWNRAVGHAKLCSAVVIQAAVRRMLVRVRLQADLGVSFDSNILERSMAASEFQAAVVIQRVVRRWMDRRERGVKMFQRVARQALARKAYENLFRQQSENRRANAARAIQGIFRGFFVRARMTAEKDAATTIQRVGRASIAKRQFLVLLELRSKFEAAKTIQRICRGTLCRMQLKRQEAAASRIKFYWLLYHRRKMARVERNSALAAITIQRFCRGWLPWREFQAFKTSARKIQRVVRHHFAFGLHHTADLGDLLHSHLARVESVASEAIACYEEGRSFDIEGPCLSRFARMVRAAATETLDSCGNDSLPRYLHDVQALAKEVQRLPAARNSPSRTPISPRSEVKNTSKKASTPIRSNKTILTVDRVPDGPVDRPNLQLPQGLLLVPAATSTSSVTALAQEARNLLLQGRERLRRGRLEMPTLPIPAATTAQPTASSDSTGSPVARVRPENKAQSPPPGESFFDGESKDIPSPIKKLDTTEEWNWADEW